MRLQTFFEKFDRFADAPNAMTKMRKLVLQLAVTGRLVEHSEGGVSSSTLLESAQSERAELVANRKIRARMSMPVGVEEQPFEVPATWRWVRLSDVGYELGQKVPDRRFSYIDVGSIDSGRGQISDRVQVLEPSEAPSRARKLVSRGTVIYSTVRPYLLNVAVVDRDFDYEPIASTAFGILHPFIGISSRFLFYWLRSAPFTSYVQDAMKGMAYPAINDEKFYRGYVPLPPPDEQLRIVEKIDELMALCDQLEVQQAERDSQQAALARASLTRFTNSPNLVNVNFLFHEAYDISPAALRKTILTLAVQGKLVPQDPSDEPADKLIAHIDQDIERIVEEVPGRAAKRVQIIDPARFPYEIPISWQWERLGRLARLIDYGTSQKADGDPTKVPVYRMGNIVGGKLVDENLKYVDSTISDLPRLFLKSGDILFNRTNSYELVGKAGLFDGQDDTATFASYLIRIQLPSTYLVPVYVNLAINAPYFRQTQIEPEVTQQCGQANFNGTKLASTLIPVPPFAEQHRIVAKVDQLMELVDELEAKLAASRVTASALMEAAVAELTTQE